MPSMAANTPLQIDPNPPTAPSQADPSPAGPSQADPQSDAPVIEAELFRASPRYWVLAIAGLGAALLLVIDLVSGFHWDALAFAIVGFLTGLWALWMATTRVFLTDDGIWVRRFSATYYLDNRQIVSATVQGRLISTFTVAYHPRLDSGIVDTDHIGALVIPGLVDQEELLDHLQARIQE